MGSAIPAAKVSVQIVGTAQSIETMTDAAGNYHVANLAPGDYDVSVSAAGFSPRTVRQTVAAGPPQTLNLVLLAASTEGTGLSLGDLGFSPAETKANPQEQARLDGRSHMLKTHQRLGLITAGPLVATIITSLNAKSPRRAPASNASGRDVHAALGAATVALYFTTAYFAIRAPKIPGNETRGPIRVHKALAWVHGTGMILTPILGEIAFAQLNRGERVHGIAKQHGLVGIITGAAYGAAIISVSFKF
jgi:carboxypeptidase family protein